MSDSHELIKPIDFDPKRLVIGPAISSSFKKNGTEFQNCSSEVLYRVGPDGSNRTKKILIQAPPQTVFGFSEQYEVGKPQSPESFRGYQVAYPVSATTSPNENEAAFITMLDSIHKAVVEAGEREVTTHDALEAQGKESKLPAPVVSSYSNVTRGGKRGDMNKFIKPLSELPNVKDTKTKDTTKPKRMYISLIMSKDLQVLTPIFGPGGKKVNVTQHVSRPGEVKRGTLTPVFEIKNVYWGSHGTTSSHGGSVKFQLAQANYAPSTGSSTVIHRPLLPTLDGDAEGSDGEDEDNGAGDASESVFNGGTGGSKMSLAEALAKTSLNDAPAPVELDRPAPVSAVEAAVAGAPVAGAAPKPRGKGKGKAE